MAAWIGAVAVRSEPPPGETASGGIITVRCPPFVCAAPVSHGAARTCFGGRTQKESLEFKQRPLRRSPRAAPARRRWRQWLPFWARAWGAGGRSRVPMPRAHVSTLCPAYPHRQGGGGHRAPRLAARAILPALGLACGAPRGSGCGPCAARGGAGWSGLGVAAFGGCRRVAFSSSCCSSRSSCSSCLFCCFRPPPRRRPRLACVVGLPLVRFAALLAGGAAVRGGRGRCVLPWGGRGWPWLVSAAVWAVLRGRLAARLRVPSGAGNPC